MQIERTSLRKVVANACEELSFQVKEASAGIEMKALDYEVFAHETMLRSKVSGIPIVKDGRLVGIITRRDDVADGDRVSGHGDAG